MKQIELKVLTGDDGLVVNYKEVITMAARLHPRGITIDDMEKAVRVLSAVKRADGVLKLEDADWEVLKTYIKVYPFSVVDETLIQFKKDIDSAPTIEV